MHTSVFISALLGAGALAFPQHKHLRLHEKKDVVFYSQWQDGPNTLIQEYIDEGDGARSPSPPAPTSADVNVKADYKNPYAGQYSWGQQYPQSTTTVTTAPSPIVTTPAVSSSTAAAAVDDSPPASTSSSVPDNTGSTTTGACNPTDGDAWSSPPCTGSSGASALDKINNLRKTWNPSLSDYKWSPTLAKNAHDTAWLPTTWTSGTDSTGKTFWTPNGEGGGWVMGHHLFSGSNGQCIAEGDNTKSKGDLTPIETMFLMWICEKPSAGIQDMCATIGSTDGDPNCECADIEKSCSCGHAIIIEDKGMNSIGCYFLNSSPDHKLDNAVNDAERAQELGTQGNSAPGMLTCDFTG